MAPGSIVTETASVHPSDWPYERAPLASACGPGWRAVADGCRPHGTLVLAGLGHAGGQGSSAYSQSVLWAPSPVADVASREMPMAMGRPEIDALVEGFAAAARGGRGRRSRRGGDRRRARCRSCASSTPGSPTSATTPTATTACSLTREVLDAVRDAVGPDRIVALRLSCDELAPWAGVTPEHAADQVDALADGVDLLTVVRGGPYSATAYRPDAHTPAGVQPRTLRGHAPGGRRPGPGGAAGERGRPRPWPRPPLADGTADLVEMTRAQIADPDLVAKVRAGAAATGSAPASSATRPAGCGTTATRW